ncbi:MAG TPA: caspase family protein [Longimicrobium sp.]|nr:caspase family protein [Longimicrobium sp.]
MPRAVSIHIGVNQPRNPDGYPLLKHSESTAGRMAELAGRAGYHSTLVLRGEAATRRAVHQALAGASQALVRGDTLFVSFSGHGAQVRDRDGDEREGADEAWCLYDGHLLDDKLAGYWRLFERGVRIVVVVESCYSAGSCRAGDLPRMRWMPSPAAVVAVPAASAAAAMPNLRNGRSRGPEPVRGVEATSSCIAEPPRDVYQIRASVLLLAASREDRTAADGLFTRCLLQVWDEGFTGSYCELYAEVRQRVMAERPTQEPQILMLGAPDPTFPLAPAFRVGCAAATYRGA